MKDLEKGITCLVIDDDIDDIEFFKIALENIELPVDCVAVTRCDIALNQLEQKVVSPDIIFLDLNMRGMSGKECLKKIKLIPHVYEVPVIIFSGTIIKEEMEFLKNSGADGFIPKPTVVDDLTNSLLNSFNRI